MSQRERFPWWLLLLFPSLFLLSATDTAIWWFGVGTGIFLIAALTIRQCFRGMLTRQGFVRFESYRSKQQSGPADTEALSSAHPLTEIKDRDGHVLKTLEAGTLRDAFLPKAFLRGAQLAQADLRGADLREADLREANLSGADLRNADLTGADFGKALLCGATLRNAIVTGAQFTGSKLDQADLREITGPLLCRNASLTNAVMSNTDLVDSQFVGSQLSFADLSGSRICVVDLSDATMNGASLKNSYIFRIKVEGADLRQVDFGEAAFIDDLMTGSFGAQIDTTTRWPAMSLLPWQALGASSCLRWIAAFILPSVSLTYLYAGKHALVAACIAFWLSIPAALSAALLVRIMSSARGDLLRETRTIAPTED